MASEAMNPAPPLAPLRAANQRRAALAAAEQVAQARAALRTATDPGHARVLRARVENPHATLGEIAAGLRISKNALAGRLRRALADPATTTRPPEESPEPPKPIRAGVPSPRSARAIRVGTGRNSNLGVRPMPNPTGTRRATP